MSAPRVLTFGCRLNAHESDLMAAQAAREGLEDLVVINSCAVTSEAVRQARQAIRKARRDQPGTRIVVTGCAAQIEPDTFAAMAEVDQVIGNGDKTRPGALAPAGSSARVRVDDIMAVRQTAAVLAGPGPAPVGTRARAYVEIQNGCDHRCTFCIIPYGRGNSRSAEPDWVIDRIGRLVGQGVAEVVLTGVDLTSWGADLAGTPSLGRLVARILDEVPDLYRLRLSSIDAAEIDEALLDCLAGQPRLAPYLHLSLQHGHDLILKRMKRRHSRADALSLIDQVRAVRPDVAFGADLIAGFPTETEAHFQALLSLIEEAGLAFVHAFPFSPRPGTPAARMPQLPREVVKARAARLRDAADRALIRHLDRQLGREVEVLVEAAGRARAADFTDVGVEPTLRPGSRLNVVIGAHDGRRALAAGEARAA